MTNAPHTFLLTATGKYYKKAPWIAAAFLAEDDDEETQYLGLRFSDGFQCYYPGSSRQDYDDILAVASSGRWLYEWGQKSNYIQI
jgi:hypothetical protein